MVCATEGAVANGTLHGTADGLKPEQRGGEEDEP